MRVCPNCNVDLDDDAIRCYSCETEIPAQTNVCSVCGSNKSRALKVFFIGRTEYCENCAIAEVSSILITTTNSIEGAKVEQYLGVECVEAVLGTGLFTELDAGLADIFGVRSKGLEEKLQNSKKNAVTRLKYKALQKGANAIIGASVAYTQFHNNMTGVVMSGTFVKIGF